MSDRFKGLLLGLVASALWSSVFVAGRYATAGRGVDPILTAALRFSSGAVVAVVLIAATGRWSRFVRAFSDLPALTGLAAIGIFGMGIFVFISASLTTSINGALILNANAIFIAVFAIFIGERVPGIRFFGLILGLIGCGIVVMGSTAPQQLPVISNVLGSLAALGGAIFWAAYTVGGKRYVRRYGGPEAATVTLITGSLMLIPVALLRRPDLALAWPELLAIAWLGIFPTAVAMLMWYQALETVDSSVLGPTQYIAPPLATLLGWWLLGEPLTWTFVAGAVTIVFALWLATRPLPSDAECGVREAPRQSDLK